MLPAALRTHPAHNSIDTEHRRSIPCGFPSRVAHCCISTPRNADARATGTEEAAIPRVDTESSDPRALHTGGGCHHCLFLVVSRACAPRRTASLPGLHSRALLVPLLAPRSFPEEEENAQSPEIARAVPRSHGHRDNRKRWKNDSERTSLVRSHWQKCAGNSRVCEFGDGCVWLASSRTLPAGRSPTGR